MSALLPSVFLENRLYFMMAVILDSLENPNLAVGTRLGGFGAENEG